MNSASVAGSSKLHEQSEVKICDIIPFLDFAKCLEKISNTSGGKERIAIINRYLTHFRQKYKEVHGTLNPENVTSGDSIFSLVRLMLPSYDRTRASYNIKATVLGRMFSKILGLNPKSEDGVKLIEFKDPKKTGSSAGDLAMIVFAVLEKMFSHTAVNGPSIGELHKVLDKLAKTKGIDVAPVTQETQIQIMQAFVRRLSPVEGKWLTRIILKDIKLNVSHTQILNLVHPHAKNLFKTMSLEQICSKLNDPTINASSLGDIVLFNYFRPMLCARLNNLDENTEAVNATTSPTKKTSPRKKEEIELPSPPFVIENKWDGERFQIHYEFNETTGRHTFKYFSRQGFDFTTNFQASLSSRLQEQIVRDPPVESFILDGEMMAWRKDIGGFTLKGGNIDVKRMLPDNPNHCPTFVAFDIVYLNGRVLIENPLTERMNMLREVIYPKDSVCQLSEQTVVHSKVAVIAALNSAIDSKEEGLVVKSMNSLYEPGQRISSWLKIKPEYLESSSVSDLDLLILGAYYTDSIRRGGKITHLLAGLIQNNEFYPLVKLGSGRLAMSEMDALVADLQPHFVKTEVPGVRFGGKKRPDLYIDPKKSIVVQVKATEILYSKEYELSYTLRFARITKVRRDKSWEDTMSVKDFHQLRISCEGKLAKRTDGLGRSKGSEANAFGQPAISDSDGEETSPSSTPSKRRLLSSPTKLRSPFKACAALASSIPKRVNLEVTKIFAGKVFNVVGGIVWKEEMEKKISSHSGLIVQNPTSDMFCVIAEKLSRRVQNIISDGRFDIVKESWLEQCFSEQQLVPFSPENMFFSTVSTNDKFAKDFDVFGYSHTTKSTLAQLKEQISKVVECDIRFEPVPSASEMKAIKRQIDEEVFSGDCKLQKWSFLADCVIAFRDTIDPALSAQIQFFGGTVVENELDREITHVILGREASPRKKQHLSAFVVTRKWLEDCLESKELLSEFSYIVE